MNNVGGATQLDRTSRQQEWRRKRREEEKKTEISVKHESNSDVSWYYVTGAILIGSALLSYGMTSSIKRWAIDLQTASSTASKATVVGNIIAIAFASGAGCLVGHLVWRWELGLVVGFVGAWGSPWILEHMSGLLSRLKK